MKSLRIITAIFFSVGFLSWLIGVFLLLMVGAPMNISTDPDDPLVKTGRIKYMTKENYQKYSNVRSVLLVTGWIGFIGGSIVLGSQKLAIKK
jgi:hypothetical protein